MKAVWYERNGPAESVLIVGDKPTPSPGNGEVLVKLATSGVNPSDVKSRAGRPLAFDFIIPHSDGAGVIEAVGEGVSSARIGERVWVWNAQWQRQSGTTAEYISIAENQAVGLSEAINFKTAACFGIPGLTAAHGVNLAKDNPSETVLVTGAASSVGHYIVQMLVQEGKKVIGTASSSKHQIVRDAGAIEAIDYQNEDVAARILEITDGKGVGAVIDMDFSSTSLLVNTGAIAPDGAIYCYGSNDMGDVSVPFRDLLFKSITLQFFLVYELNNKEREAAIARLDKFIGIAGASTRIDTVFTLDEIVNAHQRVETGKASGNVVIEF